MPQRQFTCAESSPETMICLPAKLISDQPVPQPVGRPPKVDQVYRDRLRQLVAQSPKQFGYSFDRWTAYWLRRHLLEELDVAVSERHINRLLRQMGLSTRQRISAKQLAQQRYRHRIKIGDLRPDAAAES